MNNRYSYEVGVAVAGAVLVEVGTMVGGGAVGVAVSTIVGVEVAIGVIVAGSVLVGTCVSVALGVGNVVGDAWIVGRTGGCG